MMIIRKEEKMSATQARYWRAKAEELKGQVDVLDPWRARMTALRDEFPKGTRIYRASTGGQWGKSAVIVTL